MPLQPVLSEAEVRRLSQRVFAWPKTLAPATDGYFRPCGEYMSRGRRCVCPAAGTMPRTVATSSLASRYLTSGR